MKMILVLAYFIFEFGEDLKLDVFPLIQILLLQFLQVNFRDKLNKRISYDFEFFLIKDFEVEEAVGDEVEGESPAKIVFPCFFQCFRLSLFIYLMFNYEIVKHV